MKYAVVRISGHQYKISEGAEILVDKLSDEVKADVLLTVDGEAVKVGTPLVEGAKVAFTNLGEEKGEKIDVFKYKSKARSRRKVGFRAVHTRLKVDKITA